MATTATRSVLEVDGLSVSFGGISALQEVAFGIGPGEIVGLVGPNGSGKSTLLNAVGGLVGGAQVTGEVRVLGRAGGRSSAALARAGVGRSFQNPTLLEDSTLVENLLCGAHTALRGSWLSQLVRPGMVHREQLALQERALGLLGDVGLDQQAFDLVARKPYGTRKLIDILRAFMARPSLVLLDEPTSGLDGQDRHVVAELLRKRRAGSEVSILVVEHHFELLRAVADRVVALSAGRVIITGTPREVFESEEFRATLTGSKPTAETDGRAPGGAPASSTGGDLGAGIERGGR